MAPVVYTPFSPDVGFSGCDSGLLVTLPRIRMDRGIGHCGSVSTDVRLHLVDPSGRQTILHELGEQLRRKQDRGQILEAYHALKCWEEEKRCEY